MRIYHIHHRHHHMHHPPNQLMMIFAGVLLQVFSVFGRLKYVVEIMFLMGILIVMLGLYLIEQKNLFPGLFIVLVMFGVISFLIFEFFFAFVLYAIYVYYLWKAFGFKKLHHIGRFTL